MVHLLTSATGDLTVKWKAGLILGENVPKKFENYTKVVFFTKRALRQGQRDAWYFSFNIAKNGLYKEISGNLKELFLKQQIDPEIHVLIIQNADKILGHEWREVLNSYRSQNEDVNNVLAEKLNGFQAAPEPLKIDLKTKEDRFKGALFGHVIGDAMGAPIEILSLEEIKERYGLVTDFVRYEYQTLDEGDYTDDSAFTFAGMDSILSQHGFNVYDYSKRLSELITAMDLGQDNDRHYGSGSIMAMRRLSVGQHWKFSGNNNPKNGAAIRMVPLAIVDCFDPQRNLKKNVELACEPTHKNPFAQEAAYLMAAGVRYCLDSEHFDVEKFLDYILQECSSDEFREKIKKVRELLHEDTHIDQAQAVFGTEGLVLQCVPYTFFCFLKNPYNFKDVMISALNVDGDSDSIAAMAGSLCGALNGYSSLPKEWIDKLTAKERLASYFK